VEVGTLQGGRFKVRAKTVVLAAGGLEATRLLLLSNDVHQAGLGNAHDQLGRYYASHVSGDLGEVQFQPKSRRVVWEYHRARDGVYVKRHLRPSEEAQRREELLNIRCILTHPGFADAGHRNAVLSGAYLAKRFFKGLIPPEYSKEMAAPGFHNVPQHLRNIVLGLPGLVKFGSHWFLRRTIARRKYPSISLRSGSNAYTIHFDAEQSPNPDSRVLLGESLDPFGQRQIKVAWNYQQRDVDSVVRWKELLEAELEASGAGKFTQSPEECRELILRGFGVGSHHIGTTRMSETPRTGVVDRNCQVHGVRGLFVASPSVFPTGSFANPVLTTSALAIRLAAHLKSRDAG
jgi:choline dehydrogenase-like flavoprotein